MTRPPPIVYLLFTCGSLLIGLASPPAPVQQCLVNELAKLSGSDSVGGDRFGTVVAIDGDTAVVGAQVAYAALSAYTVQMDTRPSSAALDSGGHRAPPWRPVCIRAAPRAGATASLFARHVLDYGGHIR